MALPFLDSMVPSLQAQIAEAKNKKAALKAQHIGLFGFAGLARATVDGLFGFAEQFALAAVEAIDLTIESLMKSLDDVFRVKTLIGMLCIWTTETVLMEISFFHFHGTGRPPQDPQVQSFEPGSIRLQFI